LRTSSSVLEVSARSLSLWRKVHLSSHQIRSAPSLLLEKLSFFGPVAQSLHHPPFSPGIVHPTHRQSQPYLFLPLLPLPTRTLTNPSQCPIFLLVDPISYIATPCRNIALYGVCQHGDRCHWLHPKGNEPTLPRLIAASAAADGSAEEKTMIDSNFRSTFLCIDLARSWVLNG
jgi:hypothetical protein